MSYSLTHAPCAACQKLISFNPDHVPSITIDGQREPICEDCHGQWNQLHRIDNGLEPIALHPQAYAPKKVD